MRYVLFLCVLVSLPLKAVWGQATPIATVIPTAQPTPEPPSVSTGPALDITANSAYLTGSVFNKYKGGTAWFEYGLDGTFNNSTSPVTLYDYGVADMMNPIDGLLPETGYSFRLVAKNDAGITYGEVEGFTTLIKTTTPSLTPTPSPISTNICVNPTSLEVDLYLKRTLKRKQSKDVTVTITGEGGCPINGATVTAKVVTGKRLISVTPGAITDEGGNAVFTITAKNKVGRVRVLFKVGGLKKFIIIKVRR